MTTGHPLPAFVRSVHGRSALSAPVLGAVTWSSGRDLQRHGQQPPRLSPPLHERVALRGPPPSQRMLFFLAGAPLLGRATWYRDLRRVMMFISLAGRALGDLSLIPRRVRGSAFSRFSPVQPALRTHQFRHDRAPGFGRGMRTNAALTLVASARNQPELIPGHRNPMRKMNHAV